MQGVCTPKRYQGSCWVLNYSTQKYIHSYTIVDGKSQWTQLARSLVMQGVPISEGPS